MTLISRRSSDGQRCDVAIIGGGAAGLSAALVLGRSRRRVLVIDAGHQRNIRAARSYGYLTRNGSAPEEFLAAGRAEVTSYAVELRAGSVATIAPGFRLRLSDGEELGARRVLFATGAVDCSPDIPGLENLWGTDVNVCPYCHGWEVRGRAIGVVGGPLPAAVDKAVLLTQWSNNVTLFWHASGEPDDEHLRRLRGAGVQLRAGHVDRLVTDEAGGMVVVDIDGDLVRQAALFVAPEVRAADTLLRELGCDTNDAGRVAVDRLGNTSIPGVYAAGNVVDPKAPLISFSGDGARAAMAINEDLLNEDIRPPFSAAMEREAAELVSGHSRHGV